LTETPPVHGLVVRTPHEAARPFAQRLLQPTSAAEQRVAQPIYMRPRYNHAPSVA